VPAASLPPVEVIPTCVNLDLFHPVPRREEPGFVLGYVGSAGTWYLFDEVLECFVALRQLRPDARLLILNRKDQPYIRERLAAHGVPHGAVELKAVQYAEVARELARMHAGIFFYKPAFSRLGTAPTRMAEFLACGVPCVGNAGVGDVRAILEEERVGVVLAEFTPQARTAAMERLLQLAQDPGLSQRCVNVARERFALQDGVHSYDRIYQALLARRAGGGSRARSSTVLKEPVS
jgi:glycosyltransferase involved in cell wall biosynthesis